jgi:hypothetical protein
MRWTYALERWRHVRVILPMPAASKDKLWYSIEQGSVHLLVMSTEHPWSEKSEQVCINQQLHGAPCPISEFLQFYVAAVSIISYINLQNYTHILHADVVNILLISTIGWK